MNQIRQKIHGHLELYNPHIQAKDFLEPDFLGNFFGQVGGRFNDGGAGLPQCRNSFSDAAIDRSLHQRDKQELRPTQGG
jgi:hypothetical protein